MESVEKVILESRHWLHDGDLFQGDPNHLIGECQKLPKDKNQRGFIGGSWSVSGEEDDEKAKHEMCLMAQASSEVEFKVISLIGFRSCTSRCHYRSISKQTT
ncbi:hypothetical protein Tco_0098139 [Tanacetum coccineum]